MGMKPVAAIGQALLLCGFAVPGDAEAPAEETLYVSQYLWGPEDVFVCVETPAEILEGKVFTLNISVENRRTDQVFEIEDLILEHSYMTGFEFIRVRPVPEEIEDPEEEPSLRYDMVLPACARQEFNIRLRAKKAGVYLGEVDLHEVDGEYATRTLQTEVIAKDRGPLFPDKQEDQDP
jgi:hypothetical protein